MTSHLFQRSVLSACAAILTIVTACGGNDDGGDGPAPARVVTADWLNRSLSVFDYARLTDGESDAPDALLQTIALDDYAPGPLQLAVTPDGTTAIVAVGPGFFFGPGAVLAGASEVPPGGTLLAVDLESGEVVAEIATRHVPMNVAIHPDGTRAYTANYGDEENRGSTISVIDLADYSVVKEVEVGPGPEQLALSEDGTWGMVNVAGHGAIRTFSTANDELTFSDPLEVSSDPSDLTFVPGTDRAVVANSQGPFSYSILDVSDPLSPSVVQRIPIEGGIPYGASWIPSTTEVIITSSLSTPTQLLRLDATAPPYEPLEWIGLANTETVGFALEVALDDTGDFAFTALSGDNSLMVTDLATGTTRRLAWLADTGPTYAVFIP